MKCSPMVMAALTLGTSSLVAPACGSSDGPSEGGTGAGSSMAGSANASGGDQSDGGSGGSDSGGSSSGGSPSGGLSSGGDESSGGRFDGGSGGGGDGGSISGGAAGAGNAGSGGTDTGGTSGGGSGGSSGAGGAASFSDFSVTSASIVDGSSTHWEQGRDIAFDSKGNFVIVGGTSSSNFPTTAGAYDETYSGSGTDGRGGAGDTDVFVSRFDQQGNLLWSTFLGGYNYDRAYAVEVGPNDDVFIAGRAGDGFPTTPGVLQETFAGDDNANSLYGEQDAFVTRLAEDGGSLVWSTYVGDSGQGIIRDIDVDSAGVVYLAYTGATGDLPTPQKWGPQATRQGWDGFYGKLSADGSTLLYGNYMGGSGAGTEDGREPSVRVTPGGQVYYLTWTNLSDFGCITSGAFDTTHNGGTDLVLAYFDADDSLLWCTFLGGSGNEGVETHGLAVDGQGNAVVAAFTNSDDIPTTQDTFQPNAGGAGDAYLAIVSPAGELLHGSYFGGGGAEWAEGVAVAGNGDIVFSGGVEGSPDLPTVGTQLKSSQEGREGLIVRVSSDLNRVRFSGPYGGAARDEFRGIDVSSSGDVGIVGLTESSDYPTQNAFDSVLDADSASPSQGVVYLILEPGY